MRLRRELQGLKNHFELFGLVPAFALDEAGLERAYRDIQSRVHPDRFANAGDAERRASMQMTTQVNEAYRTLRSPLRRAVYLLELNGVDAGLETNTAMPAAFLVEQMELREKLEAARDAGALGRIEKDVSARKADLESRIAGLMDGGRDWRGVRELMFLEKFEEDVDAAYEALEA